MRKPRWVRDPSVLRRYSYNHDYQLEPGQVYDLTLDGARLATVRMTTTGPHGISLSDLIEHHSVDPTPLEPTSTQ